MTRQEHIAYMLSELGEGWEALGCLDPIVKNGWIRVSAAPSGRYDAAFVDPVSRNRREDVGLYQRAIDPRAAVCALLAAAHRRHDEIGAILAAADAAKGWEP